MHIRIEWVVWTRIFTKIKLVERVGIQSLFEIDSEEAQVDCTQES